MIRSIKSLIGYVIGATDGEIGKVKEFYFDDETWTIRYLVIETGGWLFGRKVLITPTAILQPDREKNIFLVNLTKQQIKDSPDTDTEKTISRQHEMELHQHYSWPSYWGGAFFAGGMPPSMYLTVRKENENMSDNEITYNQHLRSTNKVAGYNVKTNNGEIGNVEDFLIDDKTWTIYFIVVETGHLFSRKKVLISPKLITEIIWENSSVIINATTEKIKNSPEYYPGQIISEADAVKLI